ERPYLTRSLRVPDPVTRHLLGDDGPDPVVAPFLGAAVASSAIDGSPLARALELGVPLVYVRDRTGAAALSFVAGGVARFGAPILVLALAAAGAGDDVGELARAAGRHARLREAVLVVSGVETLAERGSSAVTAFTELLGPVVLIG